MYITDTFISPFIECFEKLRKKDTKFLLETKRKCIDYFHRKCKTA